MHWFHLSVSEDQISRRQQSPSLSALCLANTSVALAPSRALFVTMTRGQGNRSSSMVLSCFCRRSLSDQHLENDTYLSTTLVWCDFAYTQLHHKISPTSKIGQKFLQLIWRKMATPNNFVSHPSSIREPNLTWTSAEESNVKDEANANEQDSKYAIFYDEGPGYLHVKEIGAGGQARAILVHSLADGKLYVRKIAHFRDTRPDTSAPCWTEHETPGQHQLEPREVSQYRPYQSIPRLIDFKTLVHNPPVSRNPNVEQFVTYWQYCNGGNLEKYIMRHSDLKERIPEIIIWRFLWQMFKTFEFLQHCQPPVSHWDIFGGNIFVHWPQTSDHDFGNMLPEERNTYKAAEFHPHATFSSRETNDMPDFYLGDFGHATSTGKEPRQRKAGFLQDIRCISQVFKKLVFCTASPNENDKMDASVIRDRSYSTNLASTWDEIHQLDRRFMMPEDVDLKHLERFILTLGRLYPRSYTNPTVHFTRPRSVAPPILFNSREELLTRHGSLIVGPWYVCTIDPNNEVKIDREQHGLPGQALPARTLRVRNPDVVVSPTRPAIPVPTASAYYGNSADPSDPESESSESSEALKPSNSAPVITRAATRMQHPQLMIQTQMTNPWPSRLALGLNALAPSFAPGAAQNQVSLQHTEEDIRAHMNEVCENPLQYDEGEDDDMYGPAQ